MTSKAAKAKETERKQRMDTSSLMEQVLSKENLNAVYLQVVRNKGAAGVDGMAVDELGEYLSENGESIREQLQTGKYKPQPVRRVEIPKPGGGIRNLGVPTVVDRFVQQAVAQVLTPIFEEQRAGFCLICRRPYHNGREQTGGRTGNEERDLIHRGKAWAESERRKEQG